MFQAIFSSRRVLAVIAMFLLVVSALGLTGNVASAEPLATNDIVKQLITECKQLKNVDKSNQGACNSDNMTHARNIAEQNCNINDSTINDKTASDCIHNTALGYIKDASSPKPKNASDFTNAINAALKKAGGDPNKTVGAAQGSVAPEVQCASGSCSDEAIQHCNSNNKSCDFVGNYINPFIKVLTLVFGVLVVISLILGGIQYSTSAGDPQQTSKAKKRIFNTIIALIAYIFLFGFLQFLIPGGLFK